MNEMGFKDEAVEKSIFYAGASCVEEIFYFIIPNQ